MLRAPHASQPDAVRTRAKGDVCTVQATPYVLPVRVLYGDRELARFGTTLAAMNAPIRDSRVGSRIVVGDIVRARLDDVGWRLTAEKERVER